MFTIMQRRVSQPNTASSESGRSGKGKNASMGKKKIFLSLLFSLVFLQVLLILHIGFNTAIENIVMKGKIAGFRSFFINLHLGVVVVEVYVVVIC